jgi:hypothetical protein
MLVRVCKLVRISQSLGREQTSLLNITNLGGIAQGEFTGLRVKRADGAG